MIGELQVCQISAWQGTSSVWLGKRAVEGASVLRPGYFVRSVGRKSVLLESETDMRLLEHQLLNFKT